MCVNAFLNRFQRFENLRHNLVQVVELAGIEPASEGPSKIVSPITVRIHSFPLSTAYERAMDISSFMNLHLPQSLSK